MLQGNTCHTMALYNRAKILPPEIWGNKFLCKPDQHNPKWLAPKQNNTLEYFVTQ